MIPINTLAKKYMGSCKTKIWPVIPVVDGEVVEKVCPICIRHQQHKEIKAGLPPIQTNGFLTRVQIDLIDMSSFEDGDYKYILSVKDLGTKFVDLSALKSKTPQAVAVHLVQLFTIIGVPVFIHTDNGSEFQNLAYKRSDDDKNSVKIDDMVRTRFIIPI